MSVSLFPIASWVCHPPASAGGVSGPGSSMDNELARFDGTTGAIQGGSAITVVDPSGSPSAFNLQVIDDSGTPFLWATTGGMVVAAVFRVGGVNRRLGLHPDNRRIEASSTSQLAWSSTDVVNDATFDTGLARSAAAKVKVTDGSSGNGTLLVSGLHVLGYVTSAGLPSTTELPTSGDLAIHKHSGTGVVSLAYNDGGAIKLIALA